MAVQAAVRTVLGTDVDPDTPLVSAGLDSISGVELHSALHESLNAEWAVTALFDHPSVNALSAFLTGLLAEQQQGAGGGGDTSAEEEGGWVIADGDAAAAWIEDEPTQSFSTQRRKHRGGARRPGSSGAAAAAAPDIPAVQEKVAAAVRTVLGADVSAEEPLFAAGLDSLGAVELHVALTEAFGVELPVSFTFDFPTTQAMTGFFVQQLQQQQGDGADEDFSEDDEDSDFEGGGGGGGNIAWVSDRLRSGGRPRETAATQLPPDRVAFWRTRNQNTAPLLEMPNGFSPLVLLADLRLKATGWGLLRSFALDEEESADERGDLSADTPAPQFIDLLAPGTDIHSLMSLLLTGGGPSGSTAADVLAPLTFPFEPSAAGADCGEGTSAFVRCAGYLAALVYRPPAQLDAALRGVVEAAGPHFRRAAVLGIPSSPDRTASLPSSAHATILEHPPAQ